MADAPAFRYARYPAGGGDEWMLLHGHPDSVRVLILAPILNETNQTRALIVDIARRLAQAGIGSAIPDLPGTGESERSLATVSWPDWRHAVGAAAETVFGNAGPPMVAALRGGALLDDACAAHASWRFAEAPGASLLRPLERAQRLSDKLAAGNLEPNGPVPLAGFSLNDPFVDALRAAAPATIARPLRTVAFEGTGVPLWRQAEPGTDPALAQQLADDLAAWISSCGR